MSVGSKPVVIDNGIYQYQVTPQLIAKPLLVCTMTCGKATYYRVMTTQGVTILHFKNPSDALELCHRILSSDAKKIILRGVRYDSYKENSLSARNLIIPMMEGLSFITDKKIIKCLKYHPKAILL